VQHAAAFHAYQGRADIAKFPGEGYLSECPLKPSGVDRRVDATAIGTQKAQRALTLFDALVEGHQLETFG
jgi:hypothetical protein